MSARTGKGIQDLLKTYCLIIIALDSFTYAITCKSFINFVRQDQLFQFLWIKIEVLRN